MQHDSPGTLQWRSKALRGPGSTVTWRPSIPSASPQGLKLEVQSAENGDVRLYGFLLLTCQFLITGVFFSCVKFVGPGLEGLQELGATVHWIAWSPSFYATGTLVFWCQRSLRNLNWISPLPRSHPRWGGGHPLPTHHPLGTSGAFNSTPTVILSSNSSSQLTASSWLQKVKKDNISSQIKLINVFCKDIRCTFGIL